MKTFLWYDTETFGLNTRYDRIAQAALIRTDLNLNVVDEPIVLYCKLTPDYLPNPSSCLVTGITPQKVNKDGLIEEEFISRIRKEMMMPDTITIGYNSIKFDDEILRSCFFRNLYDPYEREYKNGCSRYDLINLVRASHDLRPEGINFKIKNEETGFTSFRLTDLTEENNIDQTGAHDALVDVRATIAIASLIKGKQPELYNFAFTHRTKTEISPLVNTISHKPFLNTSSYFASENGFTRPLMPLFMKEGSSDVYCFDLTKEIPKEEITKENFRDLGIVTIALNRCPFISPLSALDDKSESRLGFKKADIINKTKLIIEKDIFPKTLLSSISEITYNAEILDVDLSIYSSFITQHDKREFERIKKMRPDERLKSGEHLFDDDKFHKLLWRHTARNYPQSLSKENLKKWKSFCALRLLNPPIPEALSLDKYLRTVDELLNSLDTNPKEKENLLDLKAYGLRLKERVFS